MRHNHKGNVHSPCVSLTVLNFLKLEGASSGGFLVAPISVIVGVLELPKGPGPGGNGPGTLGPGSQDPGAYEGDKEGTKEPRGEIRGEPRST